MVIVYSHVFHAQTLDLDLLVPSMCCHHYLHVALYLTNIIFSIFLKNTHFIYSGVKLLKLRNNVNNSISWFIFFTLINKVAASLPGVHTTSIIKVNHYLKSHNINRTRWKTTKQITKYPKQCKLNGNKNVYVRFLLVTFCKKLNFLILCWLVALSFLFQLSKFISYIHV